MRAALAALLLAASAALPAAAQEQVRMMRLSADRAGAASIVRVERGGPAAVSVVVVEAGRARLFLRRAAQDGGATAYEAWLDARPGITVTRAAGPGPLVLEAGGMTLRIHEADLGLRTVRCWIGALTARMEPRLLTAASDVRVLKEWLGRDRLADEFLPMRILWSAGEEPNLAPRGDLKAEEGAFTGAPWDDLLRLAKDELGRP